MTTGNFRDNIFLNFKSVEAYFNPSAPQPCLKFIWTIFKYGASCMYMHMPYTRMDFLYLKAIWSDVHFS